MNIFIVHAHPEQQSFCTSMKNKAVEVFTRQGHSVVVSDLYAMNFNPVASRADFSGLEKDKYLVYAIEQRSAYEANTLAADIVDELGKVRAADLIIFNFPLYWGSVPAILKGWIDRVFISGLCYGGRRIYNHGGLVGKKALLSLTLGGRDYMFAADGIHGDMNSLLRPLLQNTLAYVGMEVIEPFAAYHVPYITEEARSEMMGKYIQFLQSIEQQPTLEFPVLEDYDKTMKKQ